MADIEHGRSSELQGEYPRELRGLTDNLNSLIRSNREHEERYRSSLGDLAHSLKTPLAVLRGVVDMPNPSVANMRTTVGEQVVRMDQIVQYQLQHAATSGRTALVAPVQLDKVVEKILKAMQKVYAEKKVICDVQMAVTSGNPFRCDEGDLMELFGNVMDNAFKWSEARVEVKISQNLPNDTSKFLLITVMDDGCGIDERDVDTVLSRGGRLDDEVAGHGFGLAMVKGIVDLYGGELKIGRAALGGAQVDISLPWR
ncbi:ATP-binding protein [Pseudomonadota bacterium]